MIERILFVTDLGMFGPYLLKKVMEIAQQTNAAVDILHVVEPMGVFAESILEIYLPEEDKAQLRRSGIDNVLSSIQARVEDTIRTEYVGLENSDQISSVVVTRGEPAETICKQILNTQADLVVIGNHSQNTKQGAVGAVAVKILQMSPIPVLMIPIHSVTGV